MIRLSCCQSNNVKATFFTLGWIAEKNPEIIRRIVKEGHEISNAGYWARSVTEITNAQLEEDLVRSRKALEDAGCQSDYRIPKCLQVDNQKRFGGFARARQDTGIATMPVIVRHGSNTTTTYNDALCSPIHVIRARSSNFQYRPRR